jgi:ferric-dicitrate binding protein FerR (iron transport regulator)
MSRPECQPWIAISDRDAIGEIISEEERRFQRAHEAICSACADEARVWRSLDGASLESVLDDRALEKVLAAARAPRNLAEPSSTIRRSAPTETRRIVGAVVGTLALAAGLLFMAQRPHLREPVAAMREVEPEPLVAPIEMPTVPQPTALAPATEARIAASHATCRMISPGATACLGAGSEVTTSRLVLPRRVLDLVRGRVVVSLAPQAPGTSFGVATPAGTVTAVGTIFSVEILGNGDTLARCERGEVVVQATGSTVEAHLHAGEQMRIGDARTTALPAHDRKRDLALLTYREDRVAKSGEKTADLAEREERGSSRNEKTEPRTAEVPRALGDAPRSTEPPRGLLEPMRAAEPSAPATQAPAAQAPIAQAPATQTAAPRAAEPVKAPVRDLLGRARALRAQGAFRESADAYRAAYAADPHGAEGRTALVALGGLLLSELNDPAGALASFDAYLSERKGALMQEAEFGRIRALRALGRYDSEKAAIQTFLVAHPEGPDAQVLRRRLETMGSK